MTLLVLIIASVSVVCIFEGAFGIIASLVLLIRLALFGYEDED